MTGVVGVIWVSREAEYFCGRDWTGQITLKSLWKIMRTRSAFLPTCAGLQPGARPLPGHVKLADPESG